MKDYDDNLQYLREAVSHSLKQILGLLTLSNQTAQGPGWANEVLWQCSERPLCHSPFSPRLNSPDHLLAGPLQPFLTPWSTGNLDSCLFLSLWGPLALASDSVCPDFCSRGTPFQPHPEAEGLKMPVVSPHVLCCSYTPQTVLQGGLLGVMRDILVLLQLS